MLKRLILIQMLVGCVVLAIGALVQPGVFVASLWGVVSAAALILLTGYLTFRKRSDAATEYVAVMLLEIFKMVAGAVILITGFSVLSAQASRAFGISFGALYILSYLVMLGGLLSGGNAQSKERRGDNGV